MKKDEHAVAMGKKRQAQMTSKERRLLGLKGAAARWRKRKARKISK